MTFSKIRNAILTENKKTTFEQVKKVRPPTGFNRDAVQTDSDDEVFALT